MTRRAITAVVCALALVCATAPAAFAHATLTGTSPARNAVLKTEPAQVVFKFDQGVEGQFGAVKVFDAKSERVDDGSAFHPNGTQSQLGVKLKPGLPKGTYTAAYRVISADGHPVEGGVVFSIGAAGAASSESIDQLLGSGKAGKVTTTAFDVVRGLDYLAIALTVGLLAFLLVCWQGWASADAAAISRLRRLLTGAVVLGFVAAVLGIVFEGATAGGTTFWTALDSGVIKDVLKTRFGTIWGIKSLVWLAAGATLAFRAYAMAAVPVAALLLAPALSGHADTQGDKWLLVPSDIAHVGAMSVWFGGLVALAVVVPKATAPLEPVDRTRLLARLLLRFSPLALGAVVVLLATGTIQSIEYLRSFGDFLHTGFGRAVLIKIGLVVGLVALGAINRQRLLPRLKGLASEGAAPGEAGRVLRTTLRLEVAAIVVVLGVTSALVSYPPPDSLADTGANGVNVQKRFGPLELDATVDPARSGPNTMHLYLFNAKDGAPFDGTKEIHATAKLPSKGISLPITLVKSGPGHYTANSFQLVPAGDWTIEVDDRISTFDQYSTEFQVNAK